MRKLIITLFFGWGLHFTASSQITDTLQWLRTNIEQRQHLFVHKPLQVMLDSLYELKRGIVQYTPLIPKTWSQPDTIWAEKTSFYFGEVWGGGEIEQLHWQNPDTNTHVPVISVEFSWPVPFLRKWISIDRDGLGSVDWNPQLEAFWGRYWISSIRVWEF